VQSPNAFTSEEGEQELERVARLIVAGELVAAVAHDLRQPLTAMEMNVSAALRLIAADGVAASAVAGEIVDALRDALAEQGRMRAALQVLEDLARHREPAFGSVNLVPLVHDVLRLVASEASARHIAIDVVAPPNLPPIRADETLVRQALLNLLINAIECTTAGDRPNGPITVSASTAGTRGVELTVMHFGGWRQSASGTDWALALAHAVTDAHGTSIALGGSPLAGVTATIVWPLDVIPSDTGD